jgi:UDP:flavonoid glycosyltransferase YjiC (YdhE family)
VRIVCAWELGGSLGHLARQATIARELLQSGHEVSIVVRDTGSVRGFVEGLPVAILQAPVFFGRLRMNRPQLCQAELLQLSGYRDAASLWPLWQAWCQLLRLTRAELVIADHAPTALLAAHSLGLPVLATGNGFLLPEAGEPLLDWRPFPANDDLVLQREREVLSVINSLLLPEQHLQQLSELYRCQRVIINTFSELDPYAVVRQCADYCISNPQHFSLRQQFVHKDVPHVVAYLPPAYSRLRELCEGLAACPADVVVVCPGADPEQLGGLRGPRFTLTRELTDLDATIVASDLFIGHGALGTLTQCLRHGKPMMLLPRQVEQLSNAMRVQKLGIGRVCPEFAHSREYSNAVLAALQDNSAAQQAQRFAQQRGSTVSRTFAEVVAQNVERIALRT